MTLPMFILAVAMGVASAHAAAPAGPVVLDFRFSLDHSAATNSWAPTNFVPAGCLPLRFSYGCALPGVVLDSSPFAHHGTATAGARWNRDGVPGGAYDFDGEGGCIRVPNAPSLCFGAQTADVPFTVSAWVCMRRAADFAIVSKEREWQFFTDSQARLSFAVPSGLARDSKAWSSPKPVTEDEGGWHLYAFTYDGRGASNSVAMYRDGVEMPSVSDGRRTYYRIPDTAEPLFVGKCAGRYANGIIDEVRIQKGVLPATAIQTVFRAGATLAPARDDSMVELPLALPSNCNVTFKAPVPWLNIGHLEFDIDWPADATSNAQVLAYVQDWDHFWYQNLLPAPLVPGTRNHAAVDLAPAAKGWEPRGHYAAWHYRALAAPKEVGIRVFSSDPYCGTFKFGRAFAVPLGRDNAPPFIRSLRANRDALPCFEKFELTFELPDRYANPFDTNEVAVTAVFEGPDGSNTWVSGFYSQEHFREVRADGEQIRPQGRPFWCVRFAPLLPGGYRYALQVRDRRGRSEKEYGGFTALPPRRPGFVRVSKADPRFFEFSDGSPCYPIGHNIRSPYDTRLDRLFPWARRFPRGSSAYVRYFADMAKHGENLVEVWTAPWFLGLEWTPERPGYHGIGQYNLIHAWELDRILDEAERHRIYVNLVVHNHGKFSSYSDEEWERNPFFTKNGGYLTRPEQYFDDPAAMQSFRSLMRYMTARWSYSTCLFGWELWSELDLTGSAHNTYKCDEVVEWHRVMGRAIKAMDPNDHVIGTHVCGDYTHQYPPVIALPEVDYCAMDAYHGDSSPLRIVRLIEETAAYNVPYGKPFVITEFGGSPFGAGFKHMTETLHAALWSSVCIPTGTTPMFWWWELVEEENLYPEFSALAAFMKGEDRRGPERRKCDLDLFVNDRPARMLSGKCFKDARAGHGWIYHYDQSYSRIDPFGPPVTSNIVLSLDSMAAGLIRVEFWDTTKGIPVGTATGTVLNGTFSAAVPPFARDIAFKIKRPVEPEPAPAPRESGASGEPSSAP